MLFGLILNSVCNQIAGIGKFFRDFQFYPKQGFVCFRKTSVKQRKQRRRKTDQIEKRQPLNNCFCHEDIKNPHILLTKYIGMS